MWYGSVTSNGNYLDKYMFETHLKHINNGVFIEAGAFDGTTQSNTKALEEQFGWTGLLFEPSPAMYGQCVKSRRSKVYNCALVSDSYKYDYIKGDFDLNHPMSSLNGTRLLTSTSLIEVPAKTLQSCLDECNIKHVDFFSLDVEGYELDVLNGIDWSKTSFSYILIEFNPANIKTLIKFMNSKEYSFIENVSNFSKMTNLAWDGQHNDYLFISQSLL
jgi:FkbM family methyltransferase